MEKLFFVNRIRNGVVLPEMGNHKLLNMVDSAEAECRNDVSETLNDQLYWRMMYEWISVSTIHHHSPFTIFIYYLPVIKAQCARFSLPLALRRTRLGLLPHDGGLISDRE